MKNITALEAGNEVWQYTWELFRCAPIINCRNDTESFMHRLVTEFAKKPRVFHDITDPKLEMSHFTTWFGSHARRDDIYKDEPGIEDVYWVHELYHAISMDYSYTDSRWPKNNWNNFYRKMAYNEFLSSITSEVLIYLTLPDLRAYTFKFEIWADQFIAQGLDDLSDDLNDWGNLPVFWDQHPEKSNIYQTQILNAIQKERRRAMTTPDPFDYSEIQIMNYMQQNVDWARIWASKRMIIEEHMSKFMNGILSLNEHVEWLNKQMCKDSMYHHKGLVESSMGEAIEISAQGIPFKDEAITFAEIYNQNKQKYGNSHLQE